MKRTIKELIRNIQKAISNPMFQFIPIPMTDLGMQGYLANIKIATKIIESRGEDQDASSN